MTTGHPQQAAQPITDDQIEAAYWDFDARQKGYGKYHHRPVSQRDAFKWSVRNLLATLKEQTP